LVRKPLEEVVVESPKKWEVDETVSRLCLLGAFLLLAVLKIRVTLPAYSITACITKFEQENYWPGRIIPFDATGSSVVSQ
jgi:hypothetical protein